jgi:hypothetical protein
LDPDVVGAALTGEEEKEGVPALERCRLTFLEEGLALQGEGLASASRDPPDHFLCWWDSSEG